MNGQRKEARASQKEIVGLIPAAGQGTRIGPLPCSKEIYPIGFDPSLEGRPKAVSHYLLEKMKSADIQKAYVVLRAGKWDIPNYFMAGEMPRSEVVAYAALTSSKITVSKENFLIMI